MWEKGLLVPDESCRILLCMAAEMMQRGKGKEDRAGGNCDNCLVQAEMKGSGLSREVMPELSK